MELGEALAVVSEKVIHLCSASVVCPAPSSAKDKGEVTFPVPSKRLFVNGSSGLNLKAAAGLESGWWSPPAAEHILKLGNHQVSEGRQGSIEAPADPLSQEAKTRCSSELCQQSAHSTITAGQALGFQGLSSLSKVG